jgi:hypothetical protein
LFVTDYAVSAKASYIRLAPLFMDPLVFKLNDIWIFMIFQQVSHTVLEYSIVEQMILIYRLTNRKDIKFTTGAIKNNLDSY